MKKTEPVKYENTPLYKEALHDFQLGSWQPGLDKLNSLLDQYPLERDLRALRQEMNLRARIDQDEYEDNQNAKLSRVRWFLTRVVLVVALIAVGTWAVKTYSSSIQQQFAVAQEKVENEVQSLDMSIKFRNAQNLLVAGRPSEAMSLLQEISVYEPDFPGLDTTITQAQARLEIETTYIDAINLLDNGDPDAALEIFQKINIQDPNYKDVRFQIEKIKNQYMIEDILAGAAKAANEGRWDDAITSYESIQAFNPEYRADYLEDQLYTAYIKFAEETLTGEDKTIDDLRLAEQYFRKALALRPRDPQTLAIRSQSRQDLEERLVNSYLDAAQKALVGQSDSIQALQQANVYLNEALSLRPGDEEIYLQYDLANRYMRALEYFDKGQYAEVIKDLEVVYQEEQGYAEGTARQTLYEAYTARGDSNLAGGEYEEALTDFRKAAVIAQQSPGSVLRQFEGQIKIADTLGLLGAYKESVQVYQAAVELGGLSTLAAEKKSNLSLAFTEAETQIFRGNYRLAYLTYNKALHDIKDLYSLTEVVITNEDYLTMLARRYNSTVEAILQMNGITTIERLPPNMVIQVPSLP